MKRHYLSLLLIISLLFQGCSNYTELNDLSIVVAIGLDFLPKEKKYELIIQMINPNAIANQAGAKGIPIIYYVEKGRTISEAARLASKKISRTNIYSHVNLVAIGETLAKESSLNYIFDVFERDSKIRVNIPVIIARNTSVYKVLNTIPSLEKLPAKSITGKIQNTSKLLGENREIEMRDIIQALSSKGREPTINGASLALDKPTFDTLANTEDVGSTYVFINGTAIFNKGKLVGWIDGPPAKSIQIVDNLINQMNVQVPCNKNVYDSMEITRLKTKTDIKFKKGIPIIHVNVKSLGHIDEVLCNDDFNKAKTLDTYEKNAEKAVKQVLIDGITQAQKLGSDCFGFGERFHLADPKKFNRHAKKWNEDFKKAKVIVKVDVQINNIGMRNKAYPF